jgi:hypothetical protein
MLISTRFTEVSGYGSDGWLITIHPVRGMPAGGVKPVCDQIE